MPTLGEPGIPIPFGINREPSPGEQAQTWASNLVMWCRLRLKLNLPQEALTQVIAAVWVWGKSLSKGAK